MGADKKASCSGFPAGGCCTFVLAFSLPNSYSIMLRILTGCFHFSLFILLLVLSACQKDSPTIINVTITDAKTGTIIEGAKVSYSLVDKNYQTGSDHSIKSDPSGNFTITIANDLQFYSFLINKLGYVPKFRLDEVYVKGDVNDVEVKLHPKDAVLRLIYENSSGQEKPIYLQAQSNTFIEAYGALPFIVTRPYPHISQPNSKDTLDYPFTSDEWIRLFWDFAPYSKTSLSQYQDSLYLSKGDTATYIILF